MDEASDLRPCPFCGNADLRHSTLTGAVFCEECGCEGPWSPAFHGDWNTRADLGPGDADLGPGDANPR